MDTRAGGAGAKSVASKFLRYFRDRSRFHECMNTRLLIAVCLFPVVCHAEPDSPRPPKGPGPLEKAEKKMDGAAERMPEELKERFKAAREKAMNNPKVVELRGKAEAAAKEFHAAMREEMQKIDPGLQESVRGMFKKGGKEKGGERRVWSLSDGERERLEAARAKAKDMPEVKAAAEEMKSAGTPEERDAARRKFQEAMRSAVLEVDPSLKGILDKMKPPKKGDSVTAPAEAMPGTQE